MTPEISVITAYSTALYEVLSALDTGEAFTCLEPDCCSNFIDIEWTKLIQIQSILALYNSTGALPTVESPCCPIVCGDVEVNGTPGSATFPGDVTVGDDLTVTGGLLLGGAPEITSIRRGTGTLAGGTLAVAGTWVTATTRIVATYITASPAGDANLSIAKSAGVGFTVTGEGTHSFDWIAIV
jgi:hypothetical protein